MTQHLLNGHPLLDIAIEHQPDQINAILAHDEWNTQPMIHNLIDTVERILLVDDGIQQYP